MERRRLLGAGLKPGMRVLDLASGPGFISRRIAAELGADGEVLGVDLNDKLLAVAQKNAEDWNQADEPRAGLSFKKGNVYGLDLPDNHFDFVYARFLFQHLDRPIDAMAEIRRVLKPGGRLVIADVDDSIFSIMPEPPGLMEMMKIAADAQKDRGGDRQIGRKLGYYLKRAGFEDVHTEVALITSDDIGLNEFLDITTRFIAGSVQGWAWCRDNVDACVDVVLSNSPILGRSHMTWQLNEINNLIWPSPGNAGGGADSRRVDYCLNGWRIRTMAVKIMRQSPGEEPGLEAGYDDITQYAAVSFLCHAANRWCADLSDAKTVHVQDQRHIPEGKALQPQDQGRVHPKNVEHCGEPRFQQLARPRLKQNQQTQPDDERRQHDRHVENRIKQVLPPKFESRDQIPDRHGHDGRQNRRNGTRH